MRVWSWCNEVDKMIVRDLKDGVLVIGALIGLDVSKISNEERKRSVKKEAEDK